MSNSAQTTESTSSPDWHPGCRTTLTIEKLVAGGSGLSRVGRQVVFCPHVLPGELVEAEIVAGGKGIWYAKALHVVTSHPARQSPACGYVGTCGGCQLQHAWYDEQLRQKTLMLQEAFSRVGKLDSLAIEPVVPSPKPLEYRQTLRLTVEEGPGGPVLGMCEPGGRSVCPVERCLLAVEDMHPVVKELQGLLDGQAVPAGALRQVEIRWSEWEKGCQVILRGCARTEKVCANLLDSIGSRPSVLGAVYEWLDPADPAGRKRSRRPALIRGAEHLWFSYLGLALRCGYRSFVQANWKVFEQIGKDLVDTHPNVPGRRILELYAGAAPMGMLLARERGANVTCVEVNPWAVQDAKASMARNQVRGCRVRVAAAESYLTTVQAGGFDGMLLDPPRAGLDQQVINRILALQVPQVWYLSCDMPTLARDVSRLCRGGYRVQKIQPYDMFPQTAQLETLVMLRR